MVKNLNYKQSM